VYINGRRANHHCGCKRCTHECRIYANNHNGLFVNNFASGNLFAASKPEWTQWYSYSDRYELEDYPLINEELMGHEWKYVYNHKTDFDQTFVCEAPIAIEAREKITQKLTPLDRFDFYDTENVYCNITTMNETGCFIPDYEFRYLCDRSTIKMRLEYYNMNELTLLDGGEDDARIRGIYAENEIGRELKFVNRFMMTRMVTVMK